MKCILNFAKNKVFNISINYLQMLNKHKIYLQKMNT